MSFLPFLYPVYYGYSAYVNAFFEAPLEQANESETSVRLQKGTPGYSETVKQQSRNNIKEELQPFFEKIGVREDVIISESLSVGFCEAKGTNFFTKGDAAIIVGPGFNEADKDACHWTVMHEASHIKYNDCFTMYFVPSVCTLAAAIFITLTKRPASRVASVLATHTIGFVSHTAFSRYIEGKADDLAIAESSNDELKGGRRFFLSAQALNQAFYEENQNTFWGKIIASSSGENRLDIKHPSLKSRIGKIESALKQRNVFVDARDESVKVDRLTNFISNVQSQIEKELDKNVNGPPTPIATLQESLL